mmetsp:Transcript_9098/g.21124  ORF Transcript_9098/g.21124 Transcript_9098/m.21124 type:complete len:268 (+) Transcript_9098:64-867(+)
MGICVASGIACKPGRSCKYTRLPVSKLPVSAPRVPYGSFSSRVLSAFSSVEFASLALMEAAAACGKFFVLNDTLPTAMSKDRSRATIQSTAINLAKFLKSLSGNFPGSHRSCPVTISLPSPTISSLAPNLPYGWKLTGSKLRASAASTSSSPTPFTGPFRLKYASSLLRRDFLLALPLDGTVVGAFSTCALLLRFRMVDAISATVSKTVCSSAVSLPSAFSMRSSRASYNSLTWLAKSWSEVTGCHARNVRTWLIVPARMSPVLGSK